MVQIERVLTKMSVLCGVPAPDVYGIKFAAMDAVERVLRVHDALEMNMMIAKRRRVGNAVATKDDMLTELSGSFD